MLYDTLVDEHVSVVLGSPLLLISMFSQPLRFASTIRIGSHLIVAGEPAPVFVAEGLLPSPPYWSPHHG